LVALNRRSEKRGGCPTLAFQGWGLSAPASSAFVSSALLFSTYLNRYQNGFKLLTTNERTQISHRFRHLLLELQHSNNRRGILPRLREDSIATS
jgi:hypothetical protein